MIYDLHNIPADSRYTIHEFAEILNLHDSSVRYMIKEGRIPKNYEVINLSPRKRIIVKKEALQPPKTEYVHPSKLPADVIVKINNCIADNNYIKPSGKVNIKRIAEHVNQHYWTVKRFVENDYKKTDEPRADKGISRKFKPYTKAFRKKIRECFNYHFQSNAQMNLQLALSKVKEELGVNIPVRLATEWKHSLLATHTMKHYYKTFIKKYVPHIVRDTWGETPNFFSTLEVDVWPVDVPFVDNEYKKVIDKQLDELKKHDIRKWEKQRLKATRADLLAFVDRKSKWPAKLLLCPHSVSGQDVKKGLMLVYMEYGLFETLKLDNGKEFINDEVVSFVQGVHSGHMEFDDRNLAIKVIELKQENTIELSKAYMPYGKAIVERFFKSLKDRWAAYHEAYSPNPQESRKPALQLSAVQPTLNFAELGQSLMDYVYNSYVNEERPEMFLNPLRTKDAECNRDRPKSIQEAFDRSYSKPSYVIKKVDNYLLAYHYAQKFKVTFREGVIEKTYKTFKLRYYPDPDKIDSLFPFIDKKKALILLMNPQNLFEGWLFDGNKLLCRCEDIRFDKTRGTGLDRANYIGKLQSKITRSYKKHKELIDKYERVQKDEHITQQFDESDFNPSVKIVEKEIEQHAEVVEDNDNSGELNIWDIDLD